VAQQQQPLHQAAAPEKNINICQFISLCLSVCPESGQLHNARQLRTYLLYGNTTTDLIDLTPANIYTLRHYNDRQQRQRHV